MNNSRLGFIIAVIGMLFIVAPLELAPSSDVSPMAWATLMLTGFAITWLGAWTMTNK